MSQDQTEEKTDPASERKLQKLREDGTIVTSKLGTEYSGLLIGSLIAFVLFPSFLSGIYYAFTTAFELSTIDAKQGLENAINQVVVEPLSPIVVIFVGILFAGLLFSIVHNRGFIFALNKVAPKFSHCSPAAGLKRMFGAQALTDHALSLVRLVAVIAVGTAVFFVHIEDLVRTDLCLPECGFEIILLLMFSVLAGAAIVMLISIAFDVGLQRVFFLQEQRMTKTELKQERKEAFGQPEVRQERRRLSREMLESSGSVGANAATVYFTHDGAIVALAFDPVKVPLPRIAAKSKSVSDSHVLMARLVNRNLPGRVNKTIVEACLRLPVGQSVPRSIFAELAAELREIFN